MEERAQRVKRIRIAVRVWNEDDAGQIEVARNKTECVTWYDAPPDLEGDTEQIVFPGNGWEPFPAQYPFVASRTRTTIAVTGVGAGKSEGGAYRFLAYLLRYPESHGWIVGSDYTIMQESSLQTTRQVLDQHPGLLVVWNENRHRARLVNGSTFSWRSAVREDSLRGANLDLLWIDEAGLVTDYGRVVLEGRLRGGGKRGPIQDDVTTTPRSDSPWVKKLFEAPEEDVAGFKWSSDDNPHTPPEYKAKLHERYKGQFALQEIYGEFVSWGGLVYPAFVDRSDPGEGVGIPEPDAFERVACGVDFGHVDPGAAVVIGRQPDGTLWVVEEVYGPKIPIEGEAVCWVSILKNLRRQWNISSFVCDPARPESIDRFKRHGLPAKPAIRDVLMRLSEVESLLSQGRLKVSRGCRELLRESEVYQFETDFEGNALRDMPRKKDDHCCDALGYAALELRRYRPFAYAAHGYTKQEYEKRKFVGRIMAA